MANNTSTDIAVVLSNAGLASFIGKFVAEGITTAEDAKLLSNSDLTELGLNMGQRNQLKRQLGVSTSTGAQDATGAAATGSQSTPAGTQHASGHSQHTQTPAPNKMSKMFGRFGKAAQNAMKNMQKQAAAFEQQAAAHYAAQNNQNNQAALYQQQQQMAALDQQNAAFYEQQMAAMAEAQQQYAAALGNQAYGGDNAGGGGYDGFVQQDPGYGEYGGEYYGGWNAEY